MITIAASVSRNSVSDWKEYLALHLQIKQYCAAMSERHYVVPNLIWNGSSFAFLHGNTIQFKAQSSASQDIAGHVYNQLRTPGAADTNSCSRAVSRDCPGVLPPISMTVSGSSKHSPELHLHHESPIVKTENKTKQPSIGLPSQAIQASLL